MKLSIKHMKNRILTAICLLMLFSLLSCGTTSNKRLLYLKSSHEYTALESKMKFSERDALSILCKSVNLWEARYNLACVGIINDCYFYETCLDKSLICLDGYYVNGYSGQVVYKKSEYCVGGNLFYHSHVYAIPDSAYKTSIIIKMGAENEK